MKPSIPAILLAVGLVAGAQAQTTGGTPQATTSGPSYGPVLHPRPAPSPQSATESQPQAQEERAGPAAQQQSQRQSEVDPSARPSPQPVQPEPTQQQGAQKDKDSKAKPKPRRSAQQRIEPTPRIAVPAAHPYGRVADPAVGRPAPVVPSSAQINSCTGSVCFDSAGTTYNTGSSNTGVSSDGRLCTKSGTTMQCL